MAGCRGLSLAQVGLSPDGVKEAERMVPLDSLITLYGLAADMTGVPLLGLKDGPPADRFHGVDARNVPP